MITEKEVFSAMLAGVEMRLRIGRQTSDFGEYFRKKYNYSGMLTHKAMTPEMWNVYCREKYHWTKVNGK